MVWPTLGSRTAKEQEQEQILSYSLQADASRRQWIVLVVRLRRTVLLLVGDYVC